MSKITEIKSAYWAYQKALGASGGEEVENYEEELDVGPEYQASIEYYHRTDHIGIHFNTGFICFPASKAHTIVNAILGLIGEPEVKEE